jgi:hypothetical protein
MKRMLYGAVKTVPAGDGVAIDRLGFLSAVLSVKVKTLTGDPDAASIAATVTHCDTIDGDYVAVVDIVPPGEIESVDIEADGLYQLPVDLLACKRFVKISATPTYDGGTAPAITTDCAVVLGDPREQPV